MGSSYDEVMKSKKFLAFDIDHLTPQMIQIAKEELNENENTLSSSIEQLRELVIKEKNLKCRTDDEFLLQFLRARKFNVKKAFARLQTFYQMTSKSFSDAFGNIEEEKVKKAFASGFGSHLPYRDREGAVVCFYKLSNWNTEDIDVYSIINCLTATALLAVENPATQVCGLHVVVDVRGTGLHHLRMLNHRILYMVSKGIRDALPIRIKGIHLLNASALCRYMWAMFHILCSEGLKEVSYSEISLLLSKNSKESDDALPIRIKGIHLINASAIFRYIWAIINIFLSEKLKKRVHFHNDNMESLHKLIPREILPKEYGGENTDFDPVEKGPAELEKFFPKYLQMLRDGYVKK